MTVAEVTRAAMELTREERVQVADALYEVDDDNVDDASLAWMRVFSQRADEIEHGHTAALSREQADMPLDERAAARSA